MVVPVWYLPDIQSMNDFRTCNDLSFWAKRLAVKLCMLRRERGYTQEYVAYTSGISTYTYQKFEKGESKPGTPMNPRLSTLLALASTFDIDVRELLTFE